MRKKKGKLVGAVLGTLALTAAVVGSSVLMPTIAEAGGTTGGGGGGPSAAAAERFFYRWYSTDGSVQHFTLDTEGCSIDSGYVEFDTRFYAWCLRRHSSRGEYWYGWAGFVSHEININNPNNWQWGVSLPAELTDPNLSNYPIHKPNEDCSRYVKTDDGATVTAVWIDPAKEWRTTQEERTVTKVVKVRNPGNSSDNLDYTGWTPEKIYKEAPTEASYHDKTDPNELNYSNTVTSITYTVKETHTWKYRSSDGATKDHSYSYSVVSSNTDSKTITYNGSAPTISQEKYKPINLNRNGYAKSGDGGLTSDFANASTGIAASVNNEQGITDNSDIKTLDVNNQTDFTFSFNSSSAFGLPSKYNWNNTPSKLANSTWENADGTKYANGRNDSADSDGKLRYNLKFYASISNNTKNSSVSSSSLLFGGQELLANQLLTKSYTGVGSFTGGDWSSRFIYSDSYNTDNESTLSDKWAKWWGDKYSESRFYEYGTEYWGKITTSGVNNPHTVSKGTGKANGSNYAITTNADNNERGLYVGIATQQYEQPVLYGHWSVVTLAGDVS